CGRPSLQRRTFAAGALLDDDSSCCANGMFELIVCADCAPPVHAEAGSEFVLILAAACSRYGSLKMRSPMDRRLELSV
ncbi:MAG: hypothetical protein ACYS14_04055, partial [Planctomycetota bacterium]